MTSNNLSTPTRRVALALVAGTAVNAAAIASQTGVAATPVSDPIFAVIEEWNHARYINSSFIAAAAEVERLLPEEQRTWSSVGKNMTPPPGCTDHPTHIETEIGLAQSYQHFEDAARLLFTTRPTTLAGVVAVLEVVGATTWNGPYPSPEFAGEDPMLFYLSNLSDGPAVDAALRFPQLIASVLRQLALRNMLPLPATSADPVFAAIERHRKAYDAITNAVAANPDLPDEEGYPMSAFECECMRDLLRTIPSTVAGAVAVLRYLDTPDRDFTDLVMERGTEQDNYASVRVLLQSLAAGLAGVQS